MTRYIIYILTLFLISCSDEKPWTCEGNCEDGTGKKTWSDGGVDSGQWNNGNLNGKGKQSFGTNSEFTGDTYFGEFINGVYYGEGVYFDKSKDGYLTGQFKNGLPNGNGKEVFGSKYLHPGMLYEGQWKDGLYSGTGTIYWGEKGKYAHNKYIGEWNNGKMHGIGKYYWPNGDHYEGPWQNDNQHGDGIYIFKNGDTIKGHWDEGYCQVLAKKLGLE